MAIKRVTKYQTRDGGEFEDEREAIRHDRHCAIVEALQITFPHQLTRNTLDFLAEHAHLVYNLLASHVTVTPPAPDAWVCMNCGCKMAVDHGQEVKPAKCLCICKQGPNPECPVHTAEWRDEAARKTALLGDDNWGGANVAPRTPRRRDLADVAKDVDEGTA